MEQISGLVQFRGLSGFAHISLLTDMQFSNLADLDFCFPQLAAHKFSVSKAQLKLCSTGPVL